MNTQPPARGVAEAAAARLSDPRLRPVVDELARRYTDDPAAPIRRIRLHALGDDERAAVADLFGDDRLPGDSPSIQVDRLVHTLGLATVTDLHAAIELVVGPLHDRRATRVAAQHTRDRLWAWFELECASIRIDGLGALREWPAAVRREGVRGTVDDRRELLDMALRCLRTLPLDGTPLAVLASELTGDPHALDVGRALARLVTHAIADAAGEPPPGDAERTRALWELAGVVPDPLSSTVLALGLRAGDDHPLAGYLDAHAAAGEAVALTLAQLRRWPITAMAAGDPVFVVENPSILAAAMRRGWRGPTLVCSSGHPTLAVVTLLRQLMAGGCDCFQHADFDAAGITITRWLASRAGTTPWHMAAPDYIAALGARSAGPTIPGAVPDTPWDDELAVAMSDRRRAVYEEHLAEILLDQMTSRVPE